MFKYLDVKSPDGHSRKPFDWGRQELMAIEGVSREVMTKMRDQRAGGVRIHMDSRVCMLRVVSALIVWTAVLEYTQRFGVPVLDPKI